MGLGRPNKSTFFSIYSSPQWLVLMTELFCSSPEALHFSGVQAMFLTPFYGIIRALGVLKTQHLYGPGSLFQTMVCESYPAVTMVLRPLSSVVPVACCGFLLWNQLIIPFHWAARAASQTFLMDQPLFPLHQLLPDLWLIMNSLSSCWGSSGIASNLVPLRSSCLWGFSGLACHLHIKSV